MIIKIEKQNRYGNYKRTYPANYQPVWAAMGLVLGIALMDVGIWPLGIVMVLCLSLLHRANGKKEHFLLFVLCLCLGMGTMQSHTEELEQAQARLLHTGNHAVTLTGQVTESKKNQSYCWLQSDSGERLYMTLPYDGYDAETETWNVWYPAGTTVTVTGQLSAPVGARNPGGFDEAAWLKSKQTAVKLKAEYVEVLQAPQGIWHVVLQLHNTIEHLLYQTLDIDEANLAMALLTGAKHQLDDRFYRMTQQMGIAHIFAVSGLHVGVIGTVVLALFRLCGWERSWISFVLLAIGLTVYCMLVGLPASAIRAVAMILLAALAMRLYRPTNGVNFLSAAAVLILLDNPFLWCTAGFQLSFGVTLALLLYTRPIQKKLYWIKYQPLRESVAVVLAAWLGSVPLSAWHFYTITPLSPLFNFFLVPFVSLLVPLLLLCIFLSVLFPMGTTLFFLPAQIVLWLLQQSTVWMYGITASVQWNIGQPSMFVLLLYAVFLILLTTWLNTGDGSKEHGSRFVQVKKYLAVIVIVIIILTIPTAPKTDTLLYLDTGQGSCALLRTKAGEVVLFDTGAQAREVASVLAWYGINQVDAVILSHGDTDHIKGLEQVMETVTVATLFTTPSELQRDTMQPILQWMEEKDVLCYPVTQEAAIQIGEHKIVLRVMDDGRNAENSNQLTSVLLHQSGITATFPGDLSAAGVSQFIAAQTHITLWTVPHHGSKYSGSATIYQTLKQKGVQHAVISAGRDNSYGHPHEEVLQWLDNNKIPWQSTAQQGAILFELGES